MKQKLLSLFLTLSLLAFSSLTQASPTQAQLDNSCTPILSQPRSGTTYINGRDNIIFSSNNVVYNNAPATADTNSSFYIHINRINTAWEENVEIIASNLQNGVLQPIDITTYIQDLNTWGFAEPLGENVGYTVELVKTTDWPGPHISVCGNNIYFQNPTPYSCGTPSVNVTKTGNRINLNISMSDANTNPSIQTYYASIVPSVPNSEGELPYWRNFPLQHTGNNWQTVWTDSFKNGDYNLLITDGQLDFLFTYPTSTYRGCVVPFPINLDAAPEVNHENLNDQFTTNSDEAFSGAGNICSQIPSSNAKQVRACCLCLTGSIDNCSQNYDSSAGPKGIWTAVGCIKTDTSSIVASIVKLAVGLAGGIALLLILLGAFQITTSASNPEKLKGGQEIITAAIGGLIFILLSVLILRLIGIQILQIPGF